MASYFPDLASASQLLRFSLSNLEDEPAFRVAMKAVCTIEDGPTKLLSPLLDGPSATLALATKLFRRMGQYRCLPFVAGMVCHPAPCVRLAAVEVVSSHGNSSHLALMEGATRDPDEKVRARATKAVQTLRVIGDIPRRVVDTSLDTEEQLIAALVLGLPDAEGDLDGLLGMLGKTLSPAVAGLAMQRIAALGRTGVDRIIERLPPVNGPEAPEAILCYLASLPEGRVFAYFRERINTNRRLAAGELKALSGTCDGAFAAHIVDLLSRDSQFGYWSEGWAVIKACGSAAAGSLATAYADTQNVNIRSKGGLLLAEHLGKEALPLLLDAIDDPLQWVRKDAEQGLVALGSVAAVGAAEKLKHAGKLARPHLINVLGLVADPSTLDCLLTLAAGPDREEARLAVAALGRFRGSKWEQVVRAGLSSDDWRDRVAALSAASGWSGEWVIEALAAALFDPHAKVRRVAGRGLGEIGSLGRAKELDVVRILRARLAHVDPLSGVPDDLKAAVRAIVTRVRAEAPRDPKDDSARNLASDLDVDVSIRLGENADAFAGAMNVSVADILAESQPPTIIPSPLPDNVSLTVTAPGQVEASSTFLLDVWVHPSHALDEVIERATRGSSADSGRVASRGPVQVQTGDALRVEIGIPDFQFNDTDFVYWLGVTGSTNFSIVVPPATPDGPHAGMARFSVREIPVARLHFIIEVGRARDGIEEHTVCDERFLSAFASYAREDRNEVFARIQGMQKVFPELDIFVDVASVRSGENWHDRMEREIQSRDVLYLFWSRAARVSKWVEFEWRLALDRNGLARINPVPLESPDLAPPPSELAALHFNDWMLPYLRPRSSGSTANSGLGPGTDGLP